ncbi:tetratricopeptide repeat protein, partial [Candidatus Sumerlaeota bacterium]|nr:tetratricopeptide repeat protein [Candidatus Sumerlaeota bacterium]
GEKGEQDRAIECFQKALDTPGYDTPGMAWYNMGVAFSDKGEYDRAIECYQKALDTPGYDTPGNAWNNMGIAYREKGEHDRAVECFQKALDTPGFDTPDVARNNLAFALYRKGDYITAFEQVKRVLGEIPANEPEYRRAQFLKDLIEAKIKPEALNPEDQERLKPTSQDDATATIEDRIKQKIEAEKNQYEKYLERESSELDNAFCVLRGWSSSVTLLEGSGGSWRGGGYFLKWRGKGIVIDPGFDFLQNFHDEKFHAREIDAVLVSHNHSDHNDDLKSIDDLRYEMMMAQVRQGKKEDELLKPYVLVEDSDTQAKVKLVGEEPKHRCRAIIFDLGRCHPCDQLNSDALHDLPMQIDYFPTQHGLNGATGFRIQLLQDNAEPFVLGYTSDTEYFDQLPEFLRGCDLLLAHISQPDLNELDSAAKTKKNHLGYRGLIRLIKACQPKLTVIGEFWAGITDLRLDLTHAIRERSGVEHILPTSMGLQINLPVMTIPCSQCKKPVSYKDIKVAPPADAFGKLSFLCQDCII